MKRRSFLKKSLLVTGIATGSTFFPVPGLSLSRAPSEKLNIAHIGVGGMVGQMHLNGTAKENRVALCDIDSNILDPVCAQIPSAKRYKDWRDMLDTLGNKIDGVVITAPDHVHYSSACSAMSRGIHCYCEKPLAHDVFQIRQMQKYAQAKQLVTQMGTQVHAADNTHRAVEAVKSGVLGEIQSVEVWCATVWGGHPATKQPVPVPESIAWDLWLGPAPVRDYQPCYLAACPEAYEMLRKDIKLPPGFPASGNWRCWWDFGSGGIGDMGCHLLDIPFWALDLKYPVSIESSAPRSADSDYTPRDLTCRFEFPLPGRSQPLPVNWYDGTARPSILKKYDLDKSYGVLFVGTEGAYYWNYSERFFLPRKRFADLVPPKKSIPDSPGHHAEWFAAIRSGKTTSCNFDYSGKVAEAVLLAQVSYRCGKKLQYDAVAGNCPNVPEAAQYLKQSCRKGWEPI